METRTSPNTVAASWKGDRLEGVGSGEVWGGDRWAGEFFSPGRAFVLFVYVQRMSRIYSEKKKQRRKRKRRRRKKTGRRRSNEREKGREGGKEGERKEKRNPLKKNFQFFISLYLLS